jgi:hypothetical protein
MLLPAGYEQREVGQATLVARTDVLPSLKRELQAGRTLYEWARAAPDVQELRGRGATYVVSSEGRLWVVRHAYRGGAIARVLADRYPRIGEPRPYGELRVSDALRAHRISTPTIFGFVLYPAGPFYRADVVSEYVADSVDLASAVLAPDRRDAPGRIAAWRAAGGLLRKAWDAGLVHPDLNLRNILIAGPSHAPRAWLLDLDRARMTGVLLARARVTMRRRLNRSRTKLEGEYAHKVPRAELIAFGEALHG